MIIEHNKLFLWLVSKVLQHIATLALNSTRNNGCPKQCIHTSAADNSFVCFFFGDQIKPIRMNDGNQTYCKPWRMEFHSKMQVDVWKCSCKDKLGGSFKKSNSVEWISILQSLVWLPSFTPVGLTCKELTYQPLKCAYIFFGTPWIWKRFWAGIWRISFSIDGMR